jgi:type IV pilus assembly protein PilN
MKHINLLPWRETLKKEREKRFGIITGISLGVMVAIWGGVHFGFASQIEYQKSRNDFLNTKIAEAERKIKEIEELEKEKESLVARMEAVQKLEADRSKVVHLLDALIEAVPSGLSFTTLTQKADVVTIDGFAQSDSRVASLMRKISESEWLSDPHVSVIKASSKDKRDISNFNLRFKQISPKTEEEEVKAKPKKEEPKAKGKK